MKEKLPVSIKLSYAVLDLGGNLFLTMIMFWLLYYLTDVVKLNPMLAGTAIMLARIWDAITDPAVGFLSDITKTPMGKRRPYILAGAILTPIFLVMLFSLSNTESQTVLFIKSLVLYMLLNTAYTFLNVPYSALTPEITNNYDERTSLGAYRMSFAIVGTLIGAPLAPIIISAFSKEETGFSVLSMIYGFVILLTAIITVIFVKEKNTKTKPTEIKGFLRAITNTVYLKLLLAWFAAMCAVTLLTQTLNHYFKWIYQKPQSLSLALGILLIVSLLFVPVWTLLSKRLEKKTVYATGLSIMALSTIIFFFLSPFFSVSFAYIMIGFMGIGLSTHYVMPWAIIPDVVDYDEYKSGKRAEGIYYGIWTFTLKLGQAFAALVAGYALSSFGYNASLVEQTQNAKEVIRFLSGPASAILFVVASISLIIYPITRQKHKMYVKESE